jgi:hypothetical protein
MNLSYSVFVIDFKEISSSVDCTINLILMEDVPIQKLPVVPLVDVFIFFAEIWVKICSV